MAWIESYQELRKHPKTKRLARMLRINLPQAIGHLHCLWWWALDYAPDGDLSDFTAEDIADAAEWDGDAGALLEALIECGPGTSYGFVEDDDGWRLHDWEEFGNQNKMRQKEAAKKRRQRRRHRPRDTKGNTPPPVPGTSPGHPRDPQGDGVEGVPPDRQDRQERQERDARTRVREADAPSEAAASSDDPPPNPAPTAEEMIGNDDVHPYRFYELAHGGAIPQTSCEVVDEFLAKGLEPSAVKWAIREQRVSGGIGAAYLRRILQRLHDNGLTTAEAAESDRKRRNGRSRDRPAGGGEQGVANASAYESVSADLVARWKELYPDEYDAPEEGTGS